MTVQCPSSSMSNSIQFNESFFHAEILLTPETLSGMWTSLTFFFPILQTSPDFPLTGIHIFPPILLHLFPGTIVYLFCNIWSDYLSSISLSPIAIAYQSLPRPTVTCYLLSLVLGKQKDLHLVITGGSPTTVPPSAEYFWKHPEHLLQPLSKRESTLSLTKQVKNRIYHCLNLLDCSSKFPVNLSSPGRFQILLYTCG